MSKFEILKNVGIEIVNSEEKLITSKKYGFKCSKGHLWESRLDNVLRSLKRESKGCPHCAKEITDQLSEKAVEKNLLSGHQIISYEVKQVKSDGTKERYYTVKCLNNHLYTKRTPALGEGCPKCSVGIFVGEERVRIIFETYFGKEFRKIRPEWLKNPNTQAKMEIDGYNQDLKIGFEYQGRQHYSSTTQFAGEQEKQLTRDKLKKSLCDKNNVKLYVIDQPSSYAEDKFTESVISQLEKQGLFIKKEMNFCFKKINNETSLKTKYEDFKKIVEEQNIKLVSKSLSTMEDELNFKCFNGHNFKMNGLKFKEIINGKKGRSYFCTNCNSGALIKNLITLESIKYFAKSLGFTLLSTKYTNVNDLMHWRCAHGHDVYKSYRQFQRNKTGNYCEECMKKTQITDYHLKSAVVSNETVHNVKPKILNSVATQFKTSSGEIIDLNVVKTFANSIGYQLVSTHYNNVNEKMHWKCNNSHDLHKSYRQFQRNKTGNYCEECIKEDPTRKVVNENSGKFKTSSGEEINLNTINDFAKSIGYQLISDVYKNVNEKMNWLCPNGHSVYKSYRQFQRNKTGNHCDECKKLS